MLLADGDRIVFTGDSTTDAGRGRPVGEVCTQVWATDMSDRWRIS